MRDKRLFLAAVGITLLVVLILSQAVFTADVLAKGGRGTKISWSQQPVKATLARGETFSTTVVFSSTVNLTNVSLRLTPSFKGTATISPTTFANITAGVGYSVDISITIPVDSKRSAYNGTLTVRTGHRAYALPLGLRFKVQH